MYLSRSLAVAAAATCLATLPTSAGAVRVGDDTGYRDHGPARIVVCKYGMDTFDVYADGGIYADGGSLRNASLTRGHRKCVRWKVKPGMYDIAFTQRIASQRETVILAKLKFGEKSVYRKFFHGQGVLSVPVHRGQTVKLRLESRRTGH